MLCTSTLWSKSVLLAGILFATLGLQEGLAQRDQGQYPQGNNPQGTGQQGDNQSQVQSQPQSGSFVHGLSVGAGLAIYQGDLSANPEHNVVKYIAGNGSLSLRVGADHRLGTFDQYGFGADLVYSRISGETTGNISFKTDGIALDFYADYELPYIQQGLFRVFIGAGPFLLVSPSYGNFPQGNNNFEELGTRVIGSLKYGVTIMDSFRIGSRVASSNLLDGYKGFNDTGVPDFVSFVNVSYRFDVE